MPARAVSATRSLDDVARRAKVSTATVSRVLNNVSVVRMSTRERVLQAIAELKYVPNLNARTLAGGTSRTLGMIVSNLENPFFLDIFRALDADAHRQGFDVLVANTNYRPERLATSVRLMLGRRVSGLAIVVSEMDRAILHEFAGSSLPVAFYDVGESGSPFTSIRTDYRAGMRAILEHLHGLGHRRIAFVGHHTALGPLHARRHAFLRTATTLTTKVKTMTVASADGSDGGRRAAREILASGFSPTAIVCVNDVMAVGVLHEMRVRGIKVPDDVSVTGFDNVGLAEFTAPGLTTANIPREEIGRLICAALLAPSRRRRTPVAEIILQPELVVRDSTGPVSRANRR
ncbi:MAG: LacI family DNA-binding transcriptional regulator [Gemmatimonadaceae bacterium]